MLTPDQLVNTITTSKFCVIDTHQKGCQRTPCRKVIESYDTSSTVDSEDRPLEIHTPDQPN